MGGRPSGEGGATGGPKATSRVSDPALHRQAIDTRDPRHMSDGQNCSLGLASASSRRKLRRAAGAPHGGRLVRWARSGCAPRHGCMMHDA